MEKRPIIGLNMSLETVSDENRWEARAPMTYIDAVLDAGGLPLLIPPCESPKAISDLSSVLDGIIFIGGEDYRPHHYGGRPQPERELVPERRDRFDMALAQWALQDTDLPVLGICGGHQLISLAQGGSLIQDIRTGWSGGGLTPLPHAGRDREKAERSAYRHPVTLKPNSLIARVVLGPAAYPLSTNSFHHQAVHPERPGRDLAATAWTGDGVIEAIEPAPGSPWTGQNRFILGVQWHPERMQDEEPHRQLFGALIAASQKASNGR